MIHIKKESKVFILSPASIVTGGTELVHQLADYLNKKGLNAYIIYVSSLTHKIVSSEIPQPFLKYQVKVVDVVEDFSNNILVMPEVFFSIYRDYRNIQFLFWWLSIDNYYPYSKLMDGLKFYKGLDKIHHFFRRIKYGNSLCTSLNELKKIQSPNVHAYQSTYAQQHLLINGIYNILPLSDYINSDFFVNEAIEKRRNIVLYNPAKGLKFTTKMMKKASHISFIPIKGLSIDELRKLFQSAKIYIDFGNHPGKDRLPREAVLNGCIVLVGNHGSAKYYQDVFLQNNFKFQNKTKYIDFIINQIDKYLQDYDIYKKEMFLYRKRILKERDIFYSEVNNLFQIED